MELAEAAGEDISSLPFLQNKPELPHYLEPYMLAFSVLSHGRARSIVQGAEKSVQLVHPLTFESLALYAQAHGIVDIDDFEDLCYFIQAMDVFYVNFSNRTQA